PRPRWRSDSTGDIKPCPSGRAFGLPTLGDAAFDAELVALRVGHDHPTGALRPTVVSDQRGADPEQALHLLVAGAVLWHEVEVHAVLDRLRFRHRNEDHADAVVGDQPADRVAGEVRVLRILLPARHLAPELGQAEVIGAVDAD